MAAERFIRRIEALNRSMDIPETLADIRSADIPMLSRRSDREGNSLYPVPRLMDGKELQQLYAMAAEHLDKKGA